MSAVAAGWDCHVHVFDRDAPVVPGHYRPEHAPLEAIEAEAARIGIGHLVLVQPSVYGTDNALLLRALAARPGRHRGIVVIDDGVDERALDAMHAAGVRGARLNLVSPVGERVDFGARFRALAPRLAARGWALQWYAAAEHLDAIAALHATPGAPRAVLDHCAGVHAGIGATHACWPALARLAAAGAWVKLSGWYRLHAPPPYAAMRANVTRLAALFGERMAWGSDWPHTAIAAAAKPGYATLWQPVADTLGTARAEALRDAGLGL